MQLVVDTTHAIMVYSHKVSNVSMLAKSIPHFYCITRYAFTHTRVQSDARLFHVSRKVIRIADDDAHLQPTNRHKNLPVAFIRCTRRIASSPVSVHSRRRETTHRRGPESRVHMHGARCARVRVRAMRKRCAHTRYWRKTSFEVSAQRLHRLRVRLRRVSRGVRVCVCVYTVGRRGHPRAFAHN